MKKVLSVLMVLGLVTAGAHVALGQGSDATGPKPGGVIVDTVTSIATVQAINVEKRVVTLKFDDGSAQAYKLGPEVKNFDQLKVGDKVKSTYVRSVALFVRKADDAPFAGEIKTVEVAPKGAKPGVITTEVREVTAKVESVNYPERTVVLRGPEGNLAMYAVDGSVRNFENVKVGDDLVLRVTDAVAIVVEPASQ